MRYRFYIVIVLLASFASNAQPPTRSAIGAKLDTELKAFAKNTPIPGFAVSIVSSKGVVYSRGFGYADAGKKTAFTPSITNWIASVSKTFVAVAIMKLVEENRIGLDDAINSHLPFRIENPNFPDLPITVRQLLTHTSSIVDSFETYSVGEADVVLEDPNDRTVVPAYIQPNVDWHKMSRKISLADAIRKYTQPGAKWYGRSTFLNAEPGSKYEYSNLAVSIAALIVERVSGMSFAQYTSRNVFAPLKMKDTAWDVAGLNRQNISRIYVPNAEKNATGVAEYPQYFSIIYPSGGLRTSIADLGKFLIEMIRGSSGNGKLLKKATYRQMFELQLSSERFPKLGLDPMGSGENMGICWFIGRDGSYYHLGGNIGVAAFVHFDPKTGMGSLAFGNLRDDGFGKLQEIVYRYEALFK